MRKPDFVIGDKGDPYLLRWWIIPRNKRFNIYLHKILRSDDDRALHDHPWWNVSIILRGSYIELMPRGEHRIRAAGDIVFRKATALHRLISLGEPCWTLFITGPRVREWGFACPQGFVVWHKFVAKDDKGQIGKGCDQ